MHIASNNPNPMMVRPHCEKCGWRKGGPDSWDGHQCKCRYTEAPIRAAEPRECDCCGEMKSETRFVYVPSVGDTVVCDDCSR
jgi:hypothetical protein